MRILEWLHENVFNARLQAQVENLHKRLSEQEKALAEFSELVSCKIHKFECIICGEEFARLPQQSPKRCGACVRAIREASGLSNGNGQHRTAGHNTRGVHKNHPAVKA